MAKLTEVLAMIATGSGGCRCAGACNLRSDTAGGASTDRPSALILGGASRVVVALA